MTEDNNRNVTEIPVTQAETVGTSPPPEKTREEQWAEELFKYKQEAQENYEKYLRALAEAENTRKRGIRDREEYLKYANVNMVKKILPIIDDLHRAIEAARSAQDIEAMAKGVEMTVAQLNEVLKGEGVTVIESVGKPFDPQYHEALTVEVSEEHPQNTVIEQFQTGYVMHDRVIRPSLVKVSS